MKKLYWLTTVLTPNPRLDVATHETYGGDGINKMLRRFFVCVAGRSMTLWRRSYCPTKFERQLALCHLHVYLLHTLERTNATMGRLALKTHHFSGPGNLLDPAATPFRVAV